MANYDEVLGFDYADEKAWKEFAASDILPLYTAALNITEFSRHLREKLENSFSDTFLENKGIQKMLLGGITVDGEYTENSLARFYRDHIGVHIDPRLWVSLSQEPGTEVLRNIGPEFPKTQPPILGKLNTVLKFSGNLLKAAGYVLPEIDEGTINGFIQQPESIIDEFATVYSRLIQISATYNYHTFFAISTSITPKFFLLEAYPRLKTHFDAVANLLGLVVADIPDVNETMYQGDMVLIKHKSEGFAASLYQLNQVAWHLLATFALFDSQVPPLKDEFIKNIQESNTDQDLLGELCKGGYYLTDNGLNVLRYAHDSESNFVRGRDMSLQHFFRIAAPYLFIGLAGLEIKYKYSLHPYEDNVVGYRTALYIHRNPSDRRYEWNKSDF